jgi:arylsulfatase
LKKLAFLALTLLTALAATAQERPNILLIVADDLGYADLGAFGGDIRTPNIDSLADRGRTFTQFHTAPLCSVTRAMLLSGNNNHVAGVGRQNASGPVRRILPGYEGYLSDRVELLPRLLKDVGYHTYAAGKWHLGMTSEHSPKEAGFERSYMLLNGSANHFRAAGRSEQVPQYREDDDLVDYPEGRYSTELYTDRLIEFIESGRGDGRPFFAYAAYTSPHWPLQVPDDYLDSYLGAYDDGYDALRVQRFESLLAAGIIPTSSTFPPRNDDIEPWVELTTDQQQIESRKMELYAAMVENLDFHVGRLIASLKEQDLYDNTLIVFMSDNGADGSDDYLVDSARRRYLRAHYDNSYENMGKASSWLTYGKPWAEAGSAPFSRYKGFTREGGIVAAMIATGPGVASSGTIDSTYLTVMDLAPTFLEVGGATYPDDGSVAPMLGESMVDFLAGSEAEVHDDDYVTTLYHGGRALLRQGRWKIVSLDPPFDESRFQLFDIEADPGETRNLALQYPERLASMIALWRGKRLEYGIVLPQDL